MSLRIKLGWAAAVAFCGLHATASGVAVLLGPFPASATLWSLYLEITRPFALLPQSGVLSYGIDHAGAAFVFTLAGLGALAAMRVRAPALWAGYFAAGWLLSLINLAACLHVGLGQAAGPAALGAAVKLAVIALLGFAFHQAIREMWRPRLPFRPRREPGRAVPV